VIDTAKLRRSDLGGKTEQKQQVAIIEVSAVTLCC